MQLHHGEVDIVAGPVNIPEDLQYLGRIGVMVCQGGERCDPTGLIPMYRQPVVWRERKRREKVSKESDISKKIKSQFRRRAIG